MDRRTLLKGFSGAIAALIPGIGQTKTYMLQPKDSPSTYDVVDCDRSMEGLCRTPIQYASREGALWETWPHGEIEYTATHQRDRRFVHISGKEVHALKYHVKGKEVIWDCINGWRLSYG